MKTKYLFFTIAAVVLSGCSSIGSLLATSTLVPSSTPFPTSTPQPTATRTPSLTATSEPETVPLGVRLSFPFMSFSFQEPLDYLTSLGDSSASISNQDSSILIILETFPNKDSQTLDEVIQNYVDGMETNGIFETRVDGLEAIGADVSGLTFMGNIAGRVIVTETEDGLIFVGQGVVVGQSEPRNLWESEGEAIFTSVIASIRFDFEPETDFCSGTFSPVYGYSERDPIRIGGDALDGPARADIYFDHLLGPNGESVSYEHSGSVPFGDIILDSYAVTIEGGETVTLFVDHYSYDDLKAPKGFSCSGAFPLSAP